MLTLWKPTIAPSPPDEVEMMKSPSLPMGPIPDGPRLFFVTSGSKTIIPFLTGWP